MNGDGELSGMGEMAFDLGQLKKRGNADIVAGFVPGGEVLGVSMGVGQPVQPMPVFTLEWRMENGEVRKAVKIPPPMIMALIAQMSGFMMQVMGGVQVQEGQNDQGGTGGGETNGG